MNYYFIGFSVIAVLLVSFIIIVIRIDKKIKAAKQINKPEEDILIELVSQSRLCNDGKKIDDVITRMKELNIEYIPKKVF